MRTERLFKFGYMALRAIHWLLFFVMVEISFSIAGWMLLGIVGHLVAAIILATSAEDYSQEFLRYSTIAGIAIGLISGAFFTYYVTARYRKTNGEQE